MNSKINNIISVKNLTKSYGDNTVIKGISFNVPKGEIFALLGTNGAGKTTTLECLEGLRRYDSGEVIIDGNIGVQLQSSSLPANMKVNESITFFSKWKNSTVDYDFIERIGVTPFLNKQYSQLSTGQKRRLHLALAMIGNPEIIFLDEPTAGLDVEGRVGLHKEIKSLKDSGKTIVLASHDMAEVEELCDKIAVLRNGEIVFIGTASELTSIDTTDLSLQIKFSSKPDFAKLNVNNNSPIDIVDDYYCINTDNIELSLTNIIGIITTQGIVIRDIRISKPSLEQRFLEIANTQLSERNN